MYFSLILAARTIVIVSAVSKGNMALISSAYKLIFKNLKRAISTTGINLNDFEKDDDNNQRKKHLDNFLNEDSPLKNFDEKQWATTPYPSGTMLPKKEETVNPAETSVILFPGQGNQYVGMGKHLMHYSVVQDMFSSASTILGYNLKKLCLNGPKEKLDQTEYCQPATLVCSLAAIEELKHRYPGALASCVATSGFSVGEMAALVFAGCISFEKGVHLTRVRAEAMQKCSNMIEGGMLTVLYGADSNLKEAMRDAIKECIVKGVVTPVCEVSNYLVPECKIIAGHERALKYIENNKEKYKIRKVSRLPVSGAFHTKLMKDAAFTFENALAKVDIKAPLVPLYSNVTGTPYNSPEAILRLLPRQIYSPVRWEQTMHKIYTRKPGTPYPFTYECGPGKSLTAILSRINAKAALTAHNIAG